jgi:glycosyltransferase involved in cell wall biosynthesis
MRVGLDLSVLRLTRAGTARYVNGLLPHLRELVDIVPFAWGGAGRATALLRDALWYPFVLPRRARGLDVLHCPSFRGPMRAPAPYVVTALDLAVLRHPDAFNAWTRTYSRALVPRVVRAADRVITISDFSRRELVDVLHVPDDRIRIVPPAVGEPFTVDGERAQGDYVLAVGTVEPRKNLERVAEAARLADVELRVAGAKGWGDVRVGGDGVRFLGYVSDEELARLYRGAACVAYASLYEGFGIPVLEALACGAPVVTSEGTPMAELANGAAVLVDPYEPRAIADGIRAAVAHRDELARAGPEVARAYTWRRGAELTVDVYRELA